MSGIAGRGWARLQVVVFRWLTAVVDASPDAVRFGFGHAVRRRLLQRRLVTLTGEGATWQTPMGATPPVGLPVVVLATRSMGTGGVESVVAMLAEGLPSEGFATVVLCERGGATAEALRERGVRVLEAPDEPSAIAALATLGRVEAAQTHNAPDHIIAACRMAGIPTVPVVHTTDINLTAAAWEMLSDVFDRSAAVVAVSSTVRAFTESRLPHPPASGIRVVTNGAPVPGHRDRGLARQRLQHATRADLDRATVFLSLARYDMQKNIPGLVEAFVQSAATAGDVHLVVAGPVEDWLEYAHADAIRRSSVHRDRVHLLGSSSSDELLAGADVFVLDSFFEGWPVAASEAVMRGIPIIVAEVGGAVELVGSAGERGILCDNPAGAPSDIDLADIRRARRRRRQRNHDQVARSFVAIAADIQRWRDERDRLAASAATWLSSGAMVRAHADLLGSLSAGVERD